MPAKKKTTKIKKSKSRKAPVKATKKKTSKARAKVKSKAKVKAKTKVAKTKVKAKTKAKVKAKTKAKSKQKAKPKTTKSVKTKSKTKTKPKKKITKITAKTKAKVKKTKKAKVKQKREKTVEKTKITIEKPVIERQAQREAPVRVPRPTTASTTIVGSLNFTPYQLRNGEEYMNTEQLHHFENILSTWKSQLMLEVDSTVGHMKEDVMSYPDPLDRASQEEGFNLELRTRDRERKLIKKIEQALDLIKTGDYGFCEDCGAEIGIRRLEARPTAGKCIDCKTYQEIREKQIGGG